MNDLTKTQLKRIEQLKIEIRERENELEMLLPEVVSQIPEDASIQTELGTFTIGCRTKWKYSAETELVAANLKDRQKYEQQTGKAQEIKGEPYLIYRTNE